MKSVQKYKKTKYLSFKNGQSFQIYEMAKCVFSWPAHFKNGQSGNPETKMDTVRIAK